MVIYIVKKLGHIWGIYANKAEAEKAVKDANWDAEMSGSRAIYYIEKKAVK